MENKSIRKTQMYWQEGDLDDILLHKLQKIVNKYRYLVSPRTTPVDVEKLSLYLRDAAGELLGGAILLVYQDWVEIRLLALDNIVRGFGLGKQMMMMIEDKAHELNSKKIRVETCEVNLGFYGKLGYKIGGKLEDLPPGIIYFWLIKNLD